MHVINKLNETSYLGREVACMFSHFCDRSNGKQYKSLPVTNGKNGKNGAGSEKMYARPILFEIRQLLKRINWKLVIGIPILLVILIVVGFSLIYDYCPILITYPMGFHEWTNCTGRVEGLANHEYPKILHQSYKNKSSIPEVWKESYESCKTLNPDYKHMFWSDNDIDEFMMKEYPWFYMDTFWEYEYNIERVDASRYFIMYHYGGVYIDLDIGCKYPFDEIFKNLSTSKCEAMVSGPWSPGVSNSFLASKKGHPFMKYLMHSLKSHDHNYLIPHLTVVFSTGPTFVTFALRDYIHRAEVFVIRGKLFTETFFKHVKGHTWHSWDSVIFYKFYYMGWKAFVLIGLMIVVPVVLYCLWRKRKAARSQRGGV